MAISTGDICQDAITRLQADLDVRVNPVEVSLDQLCFIFKVTNEPTDDDIRENLQDIFDWFKVQEWATTATASTSATEPQPCVVSLNWLRQSVVFTPVKTRPYVEW